MLLNFVFDLCLYKNVCSSKRKSYSLKSFCTLRKEKVTSLALFQESAEMQTLSFIGQEVPSARLILL